VTIGFHGFNECIDVENIQQRAATGIGWARGHSDIANTRSIARFRPGWSVVRS